MVVGGEAEDWGTEETEPSEEPANESFSVFGDGLMAVDNHRLRPEGKGHGPARHEGDYEEGQVKAEPHADGDQIADDRIIVTILFPIYRCRR